MRTAAELLELAQNASAIQRDKLALEVEIAKLAQLELIAKALNESDEYGLVGPASLAFAIVRGLREGR